MGEIRSLSLCIPAYNAEAYLGRLLKSAREQIIQFDEILVYDDCSTDNTAEVARQHGAIVISGDVNRGCSYGKNQLANHTKADWIHFHDADDELLPNFTASAHKWIDADNCPDIVLFDYEYRDNDTGELLGTTIFNKAELEKDPIAYAIKYQINPFCGVYKRSSFLNAGGYDTDPLVLYNEDKAFHIKMAISGLSFSVEHEINIINYRISTSMSAANLKKCNIAQYHVLEKIAKTHGDKYPLEISEKLWYNATHLAAAQEWGLAKKGLALFKELKPDGIPEKSLFINLLTRIDLYFAIWLRENMIRIFKPYLRK